MVQAARASTRNPRAGAAIPGEAGAGKVSLRGDENAANFPVHADSAAAHLWSMVADGGQRLGRETDVQIVRGARDALGAAPATARNDRGGCGSASWALQPALGKTGWEGRARGGDRAFAARKAAAETALAAEPAGECFLGGVRAERGRERCRPLRGPRQRRLVQQPDAAGRG